MRRTANHVPRGFTLIELLLGMIISTFIIGAAAGVFVTTVHSYEQGSRAYKFLQTAQTTADLIERHLRCAVDPKTGGNVIFWGLDFSEGETRGHQLTFISSAATRFPRSAPPSDACEVEFSFDPVSGDGMTMRIDSSPDEEPDGGGYRASLTNLVQSFEVQYFNGVEWVEEWFESSLPQAVEFRITFADPDEEVPEGQTPTNHKIARMISLPLAAGQISATAAATMPTPTARTPGR